ncbi:MAG: hypothetical protein ACRC33_17695 [Gemmataceae bacterium]
MYTSLFLTAVLGTGAYPITFTPSALPVRGVIVSSPNPTSVGQPVIYGSPGSVVVGTTFSQPTFVGTTVSQPTFVGTTVSQPTFVGTSFTQPTFSNAPAFVNSPAPSFQPAPSYAPAPTYAAPAMRAAATSYSFARSGST